MIWWKCQTDRRTDIKYAKVRTDQLYWQTLMSQLNYINQIALLDPTGHFKTQCSHFLLQAKLDLVKKLNVVNNLVLGTTE